MSILHGQFFKHLATIRTDGDSKAYDARIPVLMLLISAANKRLRTWHSIDSICEYTGFSNKPIVAALSWLADKGAIYNVPKEARTGSEKRIHGNRKVWQLTGIIQLGESIVDYLLIKDEDRESSLQEIQDHAPEHVKNLFQNLGLLSTSDEISVQSTPNLGVHNDPQNTNLSVQSTVEISVQSTPAKELGKENLVNGGELDKETTPPSIEKEPPPNTELDTSILIAAWHGEANHGSRLETILRQKNYIDTALKLIEDVGATRDEVLACTKWKEPMRRNGAYLFDFLIEDIPEYREKHQLEILQAKKDLSIKKSWEVQKAMKADMLRLEAEHKSNLAKGA